MIREMCVSTNSPSVYTSLFSLSNIQLLSGVSAACPPPGRLRTCRSVSQTNARRNPGIGRACQQFVGFRGAGGCKHILQKIGKRLAQRAEAFHPRKQTAQHQRLHAWKRANAPSPAGRPASPCDFYPQRPSDAINMARCALSHSKKKTPRRRSSRTIPAPLEHPREKIPCQARIQILPSRAAPEHSQDETPSAIDEKCCPSRASHIAHYSCCFRLLSAKKRRASPPYALRAAIKYAQACVSSPERTSTPCSSIRYHIPFF